MKRASDVPPVVDSSGRVPVTSAIASDTSSTNGARLGQERVGFDGCQSMRELDRAAGGQSGGLGGAPLDPGLQRVLCGDR